MIFKPAMSCDLCKNKAICKYIDIMRQVTADYKEFVDDSFNRLPDEIKAVDPITYHEPTCRFFSECNGIVIQRCNCP